MRILVTGASGQLGAYLLRRLLDERVGEITAWSGSSRAPLFGVPMRAVDLGEPGQVDAALGDARPDVILHSAAISRVDLCYADPVAAERINVAGTRKLGEWARDRGSRLVYVSTDLVFDGAHAPYRESDAALPVSCYGRSKRAGEYCLWRVPNAVVARVSLLFGPSLNGRPSFFDQQCAALREGQTLTLFTDEWRTPLSLVTAARALVSLAASDVQGTVHIGGPQRLSRWEMGQRLAATLGCDPAPLRAGQQSDAAFPEPRPRDVSLDSTRWRTLFPEQPWPAWEAAMAEFGGI